MNTPPASGLRVVVVAAGASRRLGSPKALARIRGESLVRRTVRLVAPLSRSAPIVVVPPRSRRLAAELRGLRVQLCPNPLRQAGLASSVRCGLRAARWSTAVLVLPVDLAQLSGRDLGRLVRRWRPAPRRIAGRRSGERVVTPLILPGRFLAGVAQLRGDSGLRDLVASLPPSARTPVDLPSAAADVDTPAQLAAARRSLR